MSSNSLTWILGLDASGFHKELEGAKEAVSEGFKEAFADLAAPLAGVIASVGSVAEIMEGIHGAVELGDDMVNLSNRTGIAVDQLMMLRRLFKDSGVEAEKIGPSLGKMSKYLEAAATTGEGAPLLKKQGLDPKKLIGEKPDQAFRNIGASIAAIPNSLERSAAAMAIFGKSGSELLQVFMNPDFKDAGDISKTASAMAENAYLFKEAHDELEHVGAKIQGYFIGLAGPVMAAMEPLLDLADHLDLSAVGEEMGSLLGNLATDFDKQFEEVFEDLGDMLGRLVAAIPAIVVGLFGVVMGLVEKLGQALLFAFHTPLDYLQASIQYAIELLMAGMSKIPGLNKITGMQGFKASSFDEILKQTQAEGNGATQLTRENQKDSTEDIKQGGRILGDALKDIVSPLKGAFTASDATKEQLSEEREKSRKKYQIDLSGGEDAEGLGKGKNSFADSLRRIGGGGFAGGQSDPILDENRRQTNYLKIIADAAVKRPLMPSFGGDSWDMAFSS
jgi:hypothetical protein